MRTCALLLLLAACSRGSASDATPSHATDGGPAASSDAGVVASNDGGACEPRDPADVDAGPPDAGLAFAAGSAPAAFQQSAQWSPTGAAGCEGLVPTTVARRLSFTAPADCQFGSVQGVDGESNLVYWWLREAPHWDTRRAYLPADGTAGAVVTSQEFFVASRQRGFLVTDANPPARAGWVRAFAPDGSDQGYVSGPRDYFDDHQLWPDPRGGYVERRMTVVDCDQGRYTITYELRWVDASLAPRTPWHAITSWDYSYNIEDQVLVDPSGKALVLIFFDPPMSMPCPGNQSFNAWVSEDGHVAQLATPPPTLRDPNCDDPQGGSYGSPLALEDGFAFYYPPGPDSTVSGWWARFRSGVTTSEAPPSWLVALGANVQRLANGAFFTVSQDASTCQRTVAIIGPSGQLCATLALDGSADCAAYEQLTPDGTLAITATSSCSVAWWPGLGRPR